MIIQPQRPRQIVGTVVDGPEARGRLVGNRPGVAQPALGAVGGKNLALRGPIAAFGQQAEARRALALLADHVDDPADRLRAVKRATRTPHHFHAVDIVGGDGGEIEAAGADRIDVDPVDQHQRLRSSRAANRHVGLGARRARLVHLHAGKLLQRGRHQSEFLVLHLRARHHADAGADFAERLPQSRRRHHHFSQLHRLGCGHR